MKLEFTKEQAEIIRNTMTREQIETIRDALAREMERLQCKVQTLYNFDGMLADASYDKEDNESDEDGNESNDEQEEV